MSGHPGQNHEPKFLDQKTHLQPGLDPFLLLLLGNFHRHLEEPELDLNSKSTPSLNLSPSSSYRLQSVSHRAHLITRPQSFKLSQRSLQPISRKGYCEQWRRRICRLLLRTRLDSWIHSWANLTKEHKTYLNISIISSFCSLSMISLIIFVYLGFSFPIHIVLR